MPKCGQRLQPANTNVTCVKYNKYRAILRRSFNVAKRKYNFEYPISLWSKQIGSCQINVRKIKDFSFSADFMIGDKHVFDLNIIANEFNDYFTNIGNDMTKKITPC